MMRAGKRFRIPMPRASMVVVISMIVGSGVMAWKTAAEESAMGVKASSTTMVLSSSAFQDRSAIPLQYTCDGANVSPPLQWIIPAGGVKSFALIVDDPDAPSGRWIHWAVWNLPASARSLAEHVPADSALPDGTQQGITDFGTTGYGGPCPPSGTHRYFFKLYALDTTLSLSGKVTAPQLEAALHDHVLAQAQLMGTYRRARR